MREYDKAIHHNVQGSPQRGEMFIGAGCAVTNKPRRGGISNEISGFLILKCSRTGGKCTTSWQTRSHRFIFRQFSR